MAMMHMNAKVQQYGGYTPRRRVFRRDPKLPIGAIDNPFFWGFYEPCGGAGHQGAQFDFDDLRSTTGVVEIGFPKEIEHNANPKSANEESG